MKPQRGAKTGTRTVTLVIVEVRSTSVLAGIRVIKVAPGIRALLAFRLNILSLKDRLLIGVILFITL